MPLPVVLHSSGRGFPKFLFLILYKKSALYTLWLKGPIMLSYTSACPICQFRISFLNVFHKMFCFFYIIKANMLTINYLKIKLHKYK